ncbi:MAG: RES domain-containing protein [Acidimicrobiales bacterium]
MAAPRVWLFPSTGSGEQAGVVAELTRRAERQGLNVDALLPRELCEISADLEKVLDLTDAATLDGLGIAPSDLVREDHRFTQEIGEATHEHAFQAIRSPSATGVDSIIAIFPEKLAGVVLDVQLLGEWSTADDLAGL